jgi:hypothetical protein
MKICNEVFNRRTNVELAGKRQIIVGIFFKWLTIIC